MSFAAWQPCSASQSNPSHAAYSRYKVPCNTAAVSVTTNCRDGLKGFFSCFVINDRYTTSLQVMNRQMAQSSRLGGHMADVQEAMLPFTVKGKAIAAADVHMLTQLRAGKTGEAAKGGLLLLMHHTCFAFCTGLHLMCNAAGKSHWGKMWSA